MPQLSPRRTFGALPSSSPIVPAPPSRTTRSEALADRLLQERSMGGRHRAPGLPLAVVGGRLYVVGLAGDGPGAADQQRIANCWPWQAENLVTYAHVS